MKLFKRLFKIGNRTASDVKYIHPRQINEVYSSIDSIQRQLSAAILITEKMNVENCEVERFKMYRKMFHEMWLGVAEHYNVINNVDLEQYNNERIVP